MKEKFKDSIILITGGTGSWGNELTKQLLQSNPKEIRIYSRGELSQVNMNRKFNYDIRLKFIIGDIYNLDNLKEATQDVDYIFHLAALKHVPVCEDNEMECVKTNILGGNNVIRAAIYNKVKIVTLSSTDKACNPYNLYGCCKSVLEKLFIKANNKKGNTKFVCVRAGNVIGTNGSIIPFFKNLLLNDKPIPITSKDMTRYFMDIKEAIHLLFVAMDKCIGGEIFVTKMPSCFITMIVDVMAKHYKKNPKIEIVGIRPGEKMHEMLVSEHESLNTIDLDKFKVILPMDASLDWIYIKFNKMAEKEYTSLDNLLTEKELYKLLLESNSL